MDEGRESLVADIAFAGDKWKEYALNHEKMFAGQSLNKYLALNSDNEIIARASTMEEVQKSKIFANATVRHEDFLDIQGTLTETRRLDLYGIEDLRSANLTYPVSISDQIVSVENPNVFNPAQQEMNPNKFDNDNTAFGQIWTPNPITHKTFSVPWRQQGFTYKGSLGLSESLRMVFERLDKMLYYGNDDIKINFNGTLQTIYGYTTHPNRGTETISNWLDPAKLDGIVNEVIDVIGSMFVNQKVARQNSICIYYPKNFKSIFDKDYKSNYPSDTLRERLMRIPEVRDIKYADQLADSNLVMVEMDARTIQLATASDVIVVPHVNTKPMQGQTTTAYAAMVPVIKVDHYGRTGVMHCTVA